MERIIEDVLTVVDVDWEMMAAIFVLELDAVCGVVGIGDFTVYLKFIHNYPLSPTGKIR